MRKNLLILLILAAVTTLKAQTDVQLLYNMAGDRQSLTSTVEMFKTDKHGSNYFFIDMNYGESGAKGVSLAYWEISRGLKFWKSPFEIHLEYDGGFGQYKASPNGAYQISDAWLFGGNYTWNTADFSKIFTLQVMYKNIRGKNKLSFQTTGVWTLNFWKNKFTASGFADFWREDNFFGATKTNFVFSTQPQFWYNLDSHLSLGSEIDLSSNFAGHQGFYINPTLAAKWNF